ncbi:DUF2750 domain-containing protein [Enterovibrio norvegicus]|uniref:DUF2750 domain-containing protein n=1 Tax=Enterovibrio norvegicus TaxID=188144 RepID=A0A2N7LBH1_9GAMM|nr:DUF2750 domain-containing protein [Enterovibrio norvegicus]PMN72584.1 hypothetical protein BCT27_14380 [Enterovibrio norvegicus]PMN92620.1 hypothetical protein BCT23_14165 [Enterovibrio norvegicus]
MTTSDIENLSDFISASRSKGEIWGLHCKDGWVICDSAIYEDTDVMPFWSSRDAAAVHCVDEWEDFAPVSIPLQTFIEEWLVDLARDDVMLGPDWGKELSGEEVDPVDLATKYQDPTLLN